MKTWWWSRDDPRLRGNSHLPEVTVTLVPLWAHLWRRPGSDRGSTGDGGQTGDCWLMCDLWGLFSSVGKRLHELYVYPVQMNGTVKKQEVDRGWFGWINEKHGMTHIWRCQWRPEIQRFIAGAYDGEKWIMIWSLWLSTTSYSFTFTVAFWIFFYLQQKRLMWLIILYILLVKTIHLPPSVSFDNIFLISISLILQKKFNHDEMSRIKYIWLRF